MENSIRHGKLWKMIVALWSFYNCLYKILIIM